MGTVYLPGKKAMSYKGISLDNIESHNGVPIDNIDENDWVPWIARDTMVYIICSYIYKTVVRFFNNVVYIGSSYTVNTNVVRDTQVVFIETSYEVI